MSRWIVADVMTVGAVSVEQDTPFKEIVDLLEGHRINAVPVIDSCQRVIGVVSSADLVPKIEFAGEEDGVRLFEGRRIRQARGKASATAAAELMTAPVLTVLGQTSVVQAAKIMDSAQLKRLPVVDDLGRLTGMVTRRDLLKVFLRGDSAIHREVVNEVLPDIPGVVPGDVEAEVDEGVVTLLGEVRARSLVPSIIRQVERVDGVVNVVSFLTVSADAEPSAATAPWPLAG
jgi:CBS-domain-containing membrane protein